MKAEVETHSQRLCSNTGPCWTRHWAKQSPAGTNSEDTQATAATSQWHIWLLQGLLSSPLKIFHLVPIPSKERNSSPLLNLLCLAQSSRQMWVNLKIWCPFTSCKPKWFWVKPSWCPQSKSDSLTGVWLLLSRAIIKGVSTLGQCHPFCLKQKGIFLEVKMPVQPEMPTQPPRGIPRT